MIERLDVETRWSDAVVHNGTIYLSGQLGVGDTVAEQTADCLAQVETLLKRAGSSKQHILQVIIWLADINDIAEMNSVWDAWFPEGHAPARATCEAKLAQPHYKVEMIITAAVA